MHASFTLENWIGFANGQTGLARVRDQTSIKSMAESSRPFESPLSSYLAPPRALGNPLALRLSAPRRPTASPE
jgi:hypothetical protein